MSTLSAPQEAQPSKEAASPQEAKVKEVTPTRVSTRKRKVVDPSKSIYKEEDEGKRRKRRKSATPTPTLEIEKASKPLAVKKEHMEAATKKKEDEMQMKKGATESGSSGKDTPGADDFLNRYDSDECEDVGGEEGERVVGGVVEGDHENGVRTEEKRKPKESVKKERKDIRLSEATPGDVWDGYASEELESDIEGEGDEGDEEGGTGTREVGGEEHSQSGHSSNALDARWQEKYDLIVRYLHDNHTDVVCNSATIDNVRIGLWCKRQRKCYKAGQLPANRADLLKQLCPAILEPQTKRVASRLNSTELSLGK